MIPNKEWFYEKQQYRVFKKTALMMAISLFASIFFLIQCEDKLNLGGQNDGKPNIGKPNVTGVSLRFTDIDPLPLQISGELVLVRSAYENERTQEMTSYNIYCSNSQGAEAILDSLHKMPISTDEAKYEEEFKMDVPKTSLKNCRNILVYTQNKTGESDEAASLEGGVTDRTFPQGKVTSNSFEDHPVDATVYAKLNLITNEILFTHFVFYWADADGNKVGNKIHEIEKGEPTADDSYQINLTDALKNIFVERRGDAEHANLAVHIRNDLGENENHSLIPWEDKIGKIRIVIASEVTFTDEDETQGKLKGTLTITKPLDDLIDGTTLEYKLYFGGADGLTKIGTSIATISSSIVEDMVEHPVSADTNIPANAFYLLVFVVLGGVEQGEPTALLIEDKTPSVLVTGIGFTDTDPEAGEIGGTLSFLEPADNQPTRGIASYEVYWSEDGNMKLPSSTSLATINSVSTDNTINHSIANDQAIPPGANFLLVFTNFTDGTEESEGRAVPINDLHVPVLVVSNVAFSDTDPNEGKIGGALSFQEPSIEEGFNSVMKYNLYFGDGPNSPDSLPFANTSPIAAGGMNQFVVPANTVIPAVSRPHLLVYVVRNDGTPTGTEESSVSFIPIRDAKIPNLMDTTISSTEDADEEAGNINIVLSISKETDETNLSHYVLYWGNLNGPNCAKIGGMSPIIELPKTGSNISYSYTGSLKGDCILVHLKNSDGESRDSAHTEIQDTFSIPKQIADFVAAGTDAYDLVDTFMGSGSVSGQRSGHLNTFSRVAPAASLAFGLVRVSPINRVTDRYFYGARWRLDPNNVPSPNAFYRHRPDNLGRQMLVHSFSMNSLSGPGCPVSRDFPFMVYPGSNVSTNFKDRSTDQDFAGEAKKGYQIKPGTNRNTYIRKGQPGYIRYTFNDAKRTDLNMTAEFTATRRAGIGKFTFHGSPSTAVIAFTAYNSGNRRRSASSVSYNSSESLIEGQVLGGEFCNPNLNDYTIYMAAKIKESITNNASLNSNQERYFVVNMPTDKIIYIKFALSYTSKAKALENLNAEIGDWDFNAVQNDAKKEWVTLLNSVSIKDDARRTDKSIFYSALWRMLQHPTIYNDSDGGFRGFDNGLYNISNYTTPRNLQAVYTNFSGWDIYRGQTQMLAFLLPEVASDIAQSFIIHAKHSAKGHRKSAFAFPRWTVGNDDALMMHGDPGQIIVANMYAFGARNFNHDEAWDIIKSDDTNACSNNRGGALSSCSSPRDDYAHFLRNYNNRNVINIVSGTDSVGSKTYEYTTTDFTRAQFAKFKYEELTDTEKEGNKGTALKAFYTQFTERARSWTAVVGPDGTTSAFLTRVRTVPHEFSGGIRFPVINQHFEGTPQQYRWVVPFDGSALFTRAMGGTLAAKKRNAITTLDSHAGAWATATDKTTGMYMGNQVCLATPWLFNYANVPTKTQKHVRDVMVGLYKSTINGAIPGNDDLGTLSAWYVASAIGLQPTVPGVGIFLINTPFFEDITIYRNLKNLDDVGFTPVINDASEANDGNIANSINIRSSSATGAHKANVYIQNMQKNGVDYDKSYLKAGDLYGGVTLTFTLISSTTSTWATSDSSKPPSLTTDGSTFDTTGYGDIAHEFYLE